MSKQNNTNISTISLTDSCECNLSYIMADITSLEDIVSCSVCFEIYEDPHVISPCLHTLCLLCIKRLERGGTITCPECRKVSSMKDVKKDFKTQGIIDILMEKKSLKSGHSESSNDAQVCGMCKEIGIIRCYCEECDAFICFKCQKIHKTTRDLSYHRLETIQTKQKLYVQQIQQKIDELKQEVQNTDKRLMSIAENVKEVEQSKRKQISDVETLIREVVAKIHKEEETFKQTIQNTNRRLLQNLNSRENILNNHKEDLISKINSLESHARNSNVKTLKHSVNHDLPAMTEELMAFGESIEDIDRKIDSPITVGKNSTLNVADCIGFEVEHVDDHYQPKTPLQVMVETSFLAIFDFFKTIFSKILQKLEVEQVQRERN